LGEKVTEYRGCFRERKRGLKEAALEGGKDGNQRLH